MDNIIINIFIIVVGFIVIYASLSALSSFLCKQQFTHLCHIKVHTLKVGFALGILYATYLILPYIPIHGKVLTIINKAIIFLSILIITWYTIIITEQVIRDYMERKHSTLLATGLTITIVKITILVIGISVALQSIGIAITPFLTAAGIGGLAVALALQDILANLFSGIMLVLSKDIGPGDFIKIDEETQGFIEDISLRNTKIKRAFDGAIVVIPNSKVVNASVVNFKKGNDGSYGLAIPMGVSYHSDLKKVRELTLKVAKEVVNEVEEADDTFEPIVRFEEFGDSSINFKVLFKSKTLLGRLIIKDKFIEKIKDTFDKEGIEIPYPKQDIYIKELPKQ